MGNCCTHSKITHVLTIGGCEVHAGSQAQVAKGGHEFDLVISLTGHANRKPVNFKMSKGSLRMLSHLNAYVKKRQHNLVIDWPDMQAPDLDFAFWQALYADLGTMTGRVVIHCMGGHGRTGTALAVLKFLQAGNDTDPVAWVRQNYCEEAVETSSQIDYLKREIGVITQGPHSNDYRHKSHGTGGFLNAAQRLFPRTDAARAFPKVEGTFVDPDYENLD